MTLSAEPVILYEYVHYGITGIPYHPIYKDGKWWLISEYYPMPFFNMVYLCKIPDDEALILKLKYS